MEKDKIPTSVKLEKQLSKDFKDWCWLNRVTFTVQVETLIREHLKKNPLTPAQKKMVNANQKEGKA